MHARCSWSGGRERMPTPHCHVALFRAMVGGPSCQQRRLPWSSNYSYMPLVRLHGERSKSSLCQHALSSHGRSCISVQRAVQLSELSLGHLVQDSQRAKHDRACREILALGAARTDAAGGFILKLVLFRGLCIGSPSNDAAVLASLRC